MSDKSKTNTILLVLVGFLLSTSIFIGLGFYYFYSNQHGQFPPEYQSSSTLSQTPPPVLENSVEERPIPTPYKGTAFRELFDLSNEMISLFGSSKQEGTKTGFNEITNPWLNLSFDLNDGKYHVWFFVTQYLDEDDDYYTSRAQNVDLSSITYKLSNDSWIPISRQLKYKNVGSWGEIPKNDHEIIKFSDNSIALLFDVIEVAHGHLYAGNSVLGFADNKWIDLGFVQTGGSNGGDCDDNEVIDEKSETGYMVGPCYEYSGHIEVLENSGNVNFPDLLIVREGTISETFRGRIIPIENTVYTFKNGEYVSTEKAL